jgi:hypothetical protein
MKILYILPILLFCNISFAQELPVIPMKNDIIYYSFLSKHTNQKNCLAKLKAVSLYNTPLISNHGVS